MTRGSGWLLAAGALGVVALGLPWSGQLAGAAHPARVAVVAAVVLAAAGWRTGRDGLLTAALVAVAAGMLLGGLDASAGRLALAAAGVCLVLGCRADGRRVLPGRAVRQPAG